VCAEVKARVQWVGGRIRMHRLSCAMYSFTPTPASLLCPCTTARALTPATHLFVLAPTRTPQHHHSHKSCPAPPTPTPSHTIADTSIEALPPSLPPSLPPPPPPSPQQKHSECAEVLLGPSAELNEFMSKLMDDIANLKAMLRAISIGALGLV
jgi:hypothetical protein